MKKKTFIILLAVTLAVSVCLTAVAHRTARMPAHMPEPADSLCMEPVAPRAPLLPGEEVVSDFQALKKALEDDNGITDIYFADNITMQAGGIKINPSKRNVTVSGLNPLDPGQTEPYTLTDYFLESFFNTIYIDLDAGDVNTLTVRDMNITGKNFYGPFSVYDIDANKNFLIVYERVNYNGPQLGYNRRGTIRVKDCTVRIHGGNGGSLKQEFSEARHLLFEGKNIIDSESNANSVFWHPSGGTFTLADNSSLTVISPNTSVLYGVFFAELPANKMDIVIGKHASFDLTTSGVVAPEAYGVLNSFTVREAGSFKLKTTKAAATAALRIVGALTVEKEASFIITGQSGASYPLLRQEIGDITVMKGATFHIVGSSVYPSLINLVGRSFICNDPASVLLYNANRAISAATNPSRISISAQQVNYWNTLNAGGFDAPALRRWDKRDGSDFFIDGTFSVGDTGGFTNISSNYTPGDPPGVEPNASTFSLRDARVTAFGRLELTVVQPTLQSTVITGVTRPGAAVRVLLSQQGEAHILPDVAADSMGIFNVPLDVTLDYSTIVIVKSNWQFLTTTAETMVVGGGNLEFFVPDAMAFLTAEISSSKQIVNRLHTDWEITVSDGRGIGSGWSIYARLDSEMTPDRPDLPALTGAMIFVDSAGVQTVMNTYTDVFIASHTSSYDGEIFPVTWPADKGLLLSVKPGAAFSETKYSATIIWTLVDAP